MKKPSKSPLHPAERFIAAGSMEKGQALADVIGPHAVKLLAESMVAVAPQFNVKQFTRRALQDLESLALMQRAEQVGAALVEQLPPDFADAAGILVAALGPELKATEGNGLAPFFYLPHSCVILRHGPSSFTHGMQACYE